MKVETIEMTSGDFRRQGLQAAQTLNMNINLIGASAQGGLLTVDFEYVATYFPDNSYIRLLGRAVLRGGEQEAREAAEEWAATGRISGPGGELIINAVNYNASVNAVLISRALNMAPPIVLPTLTLGQGQEKEKPKAQKVPKKK